MRKLFKPFKIVLVFTLVLLLFNVLPVQAQVISTAKRVAIQKSNGIPFRPVEVQRSALPATQRSLVKRSVTAFQTFDLPANFFTSLKQKGHGPIALTLPVGETENITLELLEENIYPDGNKAITSSGETITIEGRYFQGIIKDDMSSFAAISIYENEVAGVFSNNSGNYIVGRLRDGAQVPGKNYQVVYHERSTTTPEAFSCKTPDTGLPPNFAKEGEEPESPQASRCIKFYAETEFDVYQTFGSPAAVGQYVSTLMNTTLGFYRSAGVTVFPTNTFIWTTEDPYTAGSADGTLTQFANHRRAANGGIPGDVGQLISFRFGAGNTQGLAGAINGLCSGITRERLAVMSGTSSTAGLPTYNRSVKIFAHEYGHLLGSHHTHACVWNGNNTRIDACGGNEGGCGGNPGIPSAGTLMSYCDQVSSVNFTLGFGPQPGQRILNTVNSAPCMVFSGDFSCSPFICFTPEDVTATFNSGNNSWVISWAPVSSQNSFTVEYRHSSNPNWTTAGTTSGTQFTLSGLSAGLNYARVKTNCGNGGTTNFSPAVSFNVVFFCPLPSSLNAGVTANSATLSWSTSAPTSHVEYKPATSGTWLSLGIISGGTTTVSGLSANTTYDWRVSPQCDAVPSPGYTQSQFTTLPPACDAPTNLSTYNNTLLWGAVPGAVSYTVEYKPATETTWAVIYGVTNNYYAIIGFFAGTLYDWRVKAQCNPNTSGYSSAQFYTPTRCGSFSDLTNANITTNSATVGWTLIVRGGALSTVDHIQLEYKATGASTWTSVDLPNTTTSYDITGLTGGTTYEWRIRTICYFTGLAGYYSSSSFTTLLDCTAPTGLSGLRVSCCGDVELSWNAVTGATTYTLEVKRTNVTTWTVIDNAYPWTSIEMGLATGSYNWRVKANCAGGSSGYSESTVSSIVNTHCCKPLDKTAAGRISVHPQPASKNLTIRYTSLTDERAVISVADPSGRPQIRLSKMVVKGLNTIQLDVSKLKSGVYIVTAGTGSDAQKIKVVIQN